MSRGLLKRSLNYDFWISKKAKVVSSEDEDDDEENNHEEPETEIEEEEDEEELVQEEEDQGQTEDKEEAEETGAPEEDEAEDTEESEDTALDSDTEENVMMEGKESYFPRYYMDIIEHFTEEQTKVFKYVCKLIQDKYFRRNNPTAIFVNGPTGSGKTELLRTLGEYIDNLFEDYVCIFTASSAVAAVKYPSGKTAHSTFRFPFNIDGFSSEDQEEWEINTYVEGNIAQASLIIYDEVNMADKRLIHLLDSGLRKLMNNNKMFGGKIIIFAGDFLQVAPLSSDSQSPKFSELWPKLKTFSLTKAQRTKSDADYLNFLIQMGSDSLPTYRIEIPGPLTIFDEKINNALPLYKIQCTDKTEDIIDFVFGKHVLNNPDLCAKRAILTTHVYTASALNDIIVDRLGGKQVTYVSDDTPGFVDVSFDIDKEDKTFPDKKIKLKKGSVCMIIRNIYEPFILLNGTKVIVEEMSSDEIVVRKAGKSRRYTITRESFTIYSYGNQVVRRQFPLRLAYAMSIYKSQGQTLDKVAVDLREPPFRHGQLYMALGRVRNRKDIKVLTHKSHIIKNVAHVPHYVNEELVQD